MSTQTVTDSQKRERTYIYILVGVVLVALMVIGLVVFKAGTSNTAATAKANQLTAALTTLGVANPPSTDQIVGVLGDDGGPVCADPGGALNKATAQAQMSNGAAGPGMRPIIADARILAGEALVLKIYCPDQLPSYQNFVNNLKTDNVTKG